MSSSTLLAATCTRIYLLCLSLISMSAVAHAGDADNGRRTATMHCVSCHAVLPDRPNETSQAPPFEIIAKKFEITPQALTFWILDPHPRMNLILSQREAEDVAAYINTLAK